MRRLLIFLTLVAGLLIPIAVPATALACGGSDNKGQVLQGIGASGSCTNDSQVANVIHAVVSILSLVVGAVAVIMIVLAGFKYITSGGDSGRVSNAKSTLIYALIGVAVAALAQVIVHFVLYNTSKAAG